MKKRGKNAQVWVETVVYTLIGLTIIGIVVGVATPKIKELTDEALIEQTITAFSDFNEKIIDTQSSIGNSRLVSFKIKKGEILIDSKNDKISFILKETRKRFSEPGVEIPQGDIKILTQGENRPYDVYIILDYSYNSTRPLNITYNGEDLSHSLTQAPTAYQLLIENKGASQLDISLV